IGCGMAKDRKTAQDLASGSASRPFANDQTNRALDEARRGTAPATRSSDRDVAEFIARMKTLAPQARAGRGRLIFAMDATMSRQPTWDMALGLQADMFRAVKEVGGLRSEEHTSELQSRENLVCRLLLEKKKNA